MTVLMKSRVVFLALALSSPVALASAQAAEVVARVGGGDVTTDDVRNWLESLPGADRAALSTNPAALSQMVRQFLVRQQVLKEAKDKKFDQQADTKAKLDQVRDAALVELYLQSVVKLPDGFPAEAELQAAYEANKTAFVAPRQYKLARIFIAAGKDGAAPAKLDAAVKKLKAKGADFAAIAKEVSDADADKGGLIGWIAEPQIVPEIRSVVAGIAKGGISEPIRIADGWHIVRVEDTKAAGILPLAEVRDPLTERLRQQYLQQLREAYLAKLRQQNPLAINELALSKMTLKP